MSLDGSSDAGSSKLEGGARRSKKMKNLEKEVENIFQDESRDEEMVKALVNKVMDTPRSENPKVVVDLTPNHCIQQTPRRSTRKSVKPIQDYEEIVCRSLRSMTKSVKSNALLNEEEEEREEAGELAPKDGNERQLETAQTKWSRANIGRASQKRSRRSRRTAKAKKDKVDNAPRQECKEGIHVEQEVEMNVGSSKEDAVESVELDMELQKIIPEEVENEKQSVVMQNNAVNKDENSVFKNTAEYNVSRNTKVVEKTLLNSKLDESKKEEKTFGIHLKSDELVMKDLGLNPLQDDESVEDEKLSGEDKQKQDDINDGLTENGDDMPSLIYCGGSDEDEVFGEYKENQPLDEKSKLNNNCDTTCILLDTECPARASICNTPGSVKSLGNDEIQALEISSDEKSNERAQTVIDISEESPTELTEADVQERPTTLRSNVQITPKQKNKVYRFPTPHNSKTNFRFESKRGQIGKSGQFHQEVGREATISFTSMEPKEIVLRSIRKRSLSVSIDGNESKYAVRRGTLGRSCAQKGVTFNSPANQTTLINDLDELIAKKRKPLAIVDTRDESLSHETNVTKRRKRSLSYDDSIRNISKLPILIPVHITDKLPNCTSQSKPTRTKLPNFAAIHQKQFRRMENLVDHVARKAERSKILMNSATKQRPASAQKDLATIGKNTVSQAEKRKALKKIDLKNAFRTTTDVDEEHGAKLSELPNPRLAIIKPMPTVSNKNIHSSSNITTQADKKVLKVLQPSQVSRHVAEPIPRPAFNLSTSVPAKKLDVTSMETHRKNTQDKVATRLQRHMDMFKGRERTTGAGVGGRKHESVIRGVRSNRRFDLQMQHRKNLEN